MLSSPLSALSPSSAGGPSPAAPAPAAPASGEGSFAHSLDQARQAPPQPRPAGQAANGARPGAPRDGAKPVKEAHDDAKLDKSAEATDKAEKADKPEDDGSHDKAVAGSTDAQGPTSPDLAHLLPGWVPPSRGTDTAAAASARADAKTESAGDAVVSDQTDGGKGRSPRGKGGIEAAGDAAGAQGSRRAGAADKADSARSSAFAAELAGARADAKAAPAERNAAAPSPTLQAADALNAGAALAATHQPVGAAATHGSSAAPRFEAQLSAAVGSPEFAPALGVQVSILAREGVQEARLHLNPADMGPISVQIAVNGTQAEVNFQADVAATRQALESSLPDLAAALRDSGLTMSGGGVSDQPRDAARQMATGDESGRGQGGNGRGSQGQDGAAAVGGSAQGTRIVRPQGVVDLYA